MIPFRALVVLSTAALAIGARGAAQQPALVLVATVSLPGVEGRIDHLAVDSEHGRLYVAALGNDSVEVVDLHAQRVVRSVKGFREPQGVAFIPRPPQLVVANGAGSGVEFRGADDLRVIRTVALGEDADNVRVDAAGTRIYVGYAQGAIAVLDARDGRKLGEIPLGGHPESFQLETSGSRLFVNVPSARRIVVGETAAMKVSATWTLSAARDNYPMALDEAGHRLFVGCRAPAVVLVFDTRTGTQLSSIPISGDTDDLFWDGRRERLYVSAGEGFIDVLRPDGEALRRATRIRTASGARTSLFVPALGRLYLAVPHRGSQQAEIRVYEARE